MHKERQLGKKSYGTNGIDIFLLGISNWTYDVHRIMCPMKNGIVMWVSITIYKNVFDQYPALILDFILASLLTKSKSFIFSNSESGHNCKLY